MYDLKRHSMFICEFASHVFVTLFTVSSFDMVYINKLQYNLHSVDCHPSMTSIVPVSSALLTDRSAAV